MNNIKQASRSNEYTDLDKGSIFTDGSNRQLIKRVSKQGGLVQLRKLLIIQKI